MRTIMAAFSMLWIATTIAFKCLIRKAGSYANGVHVAVRLRSSMARMLLRWVMMDWCTLRTKAIFVFRCFDRMATLCARLVSMATMMDSSPIRVWCGWLVGVCG